MFVSVFLILITTIIDVAIEFVYDVVLRAGISPLMRGGRAWGVHRGKCLGVFLVMNLSLNKFIFYI